MPQKDGNKLSTANIVFLLIPSVAKLTIITLQEFKKLPFSMSCRRDEAWPHLTFNENYFYKNTATIILFLQIDHNFA